MPKAKEIKKTLSRAEMEAIIRGGGAIHHGGEIITSIADLPDDVDLAANEEDLEAAAAALEAEEDALFEKRRKLERRIRDARGSEVQDTVERSEDRQADGNLESLKVEELRALAEERGVDLSGLTKKAEIIAALTATKK